MQRGHRPNCGSSASAVAVGCRAAVSTAKARKKMSRMGLEDDAMLVLVECRAA
jgi:hypothetical protein